MQAKSAHSSALLRHLSDPIQRSLSCRADDHGMLRIVAVLLALGVGLDYCALGGKYTHAAGRLAYLLLYRL
jgi:hypothetical protein